MKQDLTGKVFGFLAAIEKLDSHVQPSGKRISKYACLCVCGNIVFKKGDQLKKKFKLHCGCIKEERNGKKKKHS